MTVDTHLHRRLRPYVVAFLAVAVVFGVKVVLDPVIAVDDPFLLFFTSVMASAWYGGFWSGVVAALVAGMAGDYFFLEPVYTLGPSGSPQVARLTLFLGEAIIVSGVIAGLRRSTHQADQSQRRLADHQHAMRRSEERYRAFIEQSSEGIWRFEVTEPIPVDLPVDEQIEAFYARAYLAECNEAMARMYGVSSAEKLTGARLGDLLIRSDPRNREYLAEFIRSGYRLTEAESHERQADGSTTYFSNSLVGIIEKGCLVRAWGTQRDISKRKRAEEALRGSEERLRVTLAREHAARGEAEQANRAKDEFLATLSHELRSPLQGILGWARVLRGGLLDQRAAAQALGRIERSVHQQAQLVNDLLDVSRIVAGKLVLERAPLDLMPIVEAAVEEIRLQAEEKGVRIGLQRADCAPVAGDAARLTQVVANLLSNALKFTPRGGEIAVRCFRSDGVIMITVADTGEGIRAEFLPRLFDRFAQAEGGRARHHGGLGLGLAIVRAIVEAHGGTARAESEGPGCGATFTIELPLALGDAATLSERPEADAVQETARALRGIDVLVVDDDEDARDALRFGLQAQGAHVTAVASAAEAVRAFADQAPHVIVSDLGMPNEDGYSLLQRIRSAEREAARGSTPAIAITGYAGAEERGRALAAGFQAYMAKPVDIDALVRTVTRVLGTSGGAQVEG